LDLAFKEGHLQYVSTDRSFRSAADLVYLKLVTYVAIQVKSQDDSGDVVPLFLIS
jgi:hypothetical protein